MKREFIKGLLPDISDDILKQIMDQHSTDVGTLKSKIETLETERDGLKTQLNDANTEIQSYKDMDIDGIKQKAADWEAKYNTDTQALRDKLSEQEYSYAVNGAVSGMQFTSAAAKKAFVSDLKDKGLKLEDGKLLGLDDYVKTYKESDPHAFADDNGGNPPPHVVGRTNGGNTGGAMAAMRAAMGLPNTKE